MDYSLGPMSSACVSEDGSKFDSAGQSTVSEPEQHAPAPNNTRLWGIIAGLCVINLLCALEGTVLITSLPTIAAELDLGNKFVWVNNVFSLSA